MRLHLVRHGHTAAVGRVLAGRSPGWPLTGQGQTEVARAATALAGERVAAILSSPQQRAQQTAEAFAAVFGVPVRTEAALDEIDFAGWSGRSFDELDSLAEWRAWNRLRSLAQGAGETMMSVQARVTGLVQRLHATGPDAAFVLVSHADVLRALIAYLLGMPIDLMARIELSPGSRSVVSLTAGDVRVEALNLPA